MIRTILFSTLFALFTAYAYAQDTLFSVGLKAAYNNYNFDFKNFPNVKYETENTLSAGVRCQSYIIAKLSLKTGAFYSVKKINAEYTYKFNDPNDPYIPDESKLKLIYIGIPLSIHYSIVNKEKFKFSPGAGFVYEFLLMHKENTLYENKEVRESSHLTKNLNKNLFSIQLNFDFEFHFNNKFFITLEPFFRKGTNNIDDELMKNNPSALGAALSINHKF